MDKQELKELLNYCPDSGIFTWLGDKRGHVKAGDSAGSITNSGYLQIKIQGRTYRAHRLAWLYVYGSWPENEIDHINGVRMDNRIQNLRDVTAAENKRNRQRQKTNSSGFTGVYWRKSKRDWRAEIYINNKKKHLGYYPSKLAAVFARKEAEKKYGYHPNHGRLPPLPKENEG